MYLESLYVHETRKQPLLTLPRCNRDNTVFSEIARKKHEEALSFCCDSMARLHTHPPTGGKLRTTKTLGGCRPSGPLAPLVVVTLFSHGMHESGCLEQHGKKDRQFGFLTQQPGQSIFHYVCVQLFLSIRIMTPQKQRFAAVICSLYARSIAPQEPHRTASFRKLVPTTSRSAIPPDNPNSGSNMQCTK